MQESACNVTDLGSIPGLGRSSGEGNGNPLQYSCLENPMHRGARQATVHGVAKSRTQLSDFTSNYGGGNEDNGNLLQEFPCMYCYIQCPQPCSRLLMTHTSVGDSWTLTGKSGSVSCGVTAPLLLPPGSWCTQGSVCALQFSLSE